MSLIPKGPDEVMPMIFDFRDRLGELADGAQITEVLNVDIEPSGDVDDLAFDGAVIDQVSQLAVQTVLSKGRSSQLYAVYCTVQVSHAGNTYSFSITNRVLVR